MPSICTQNKQRERELEVGGLRNEGRRGRKPKIYDWKLSVKRIVRIWFASALPWLRVEYPEVGKSLGKGRIHHLWLMICIFRCSTVVLSLHLQGCCEDGLAGQMLSLPSCVEPCHVK